VRAQQQGLNVVAKNTLPDRGNRRDNGNAVLSVPADHRGSFYDENITRSAGWIDRSRMPSTAGNVMPSRLVN